MTSSAQVAGGVGRKPIWSRDKILDTLREWVRLYGEPPRAADLNPSSAKWSGSEWRVERYRQGHPETGEPWPSLNAVKNQFGGSLNEAIRAAGFEPNKPGPPSRRKASSPELGADREVMSPAARVELDAVRAEVRDLAERVEVRDRQLARAREANTRLREDVARVRTVTKTKTKVVRERVVDDAAVRRVRERMERQVARAETRALEAEGVVAEHVAAVKEARATAGKLASRLERSEATVASLRDERREAKAALKAMEDRLVALERMLADAREAEPEVRVERVEVEVLSPEAREMVEMRSEVGRARRDRESAELRAAKAERELRETVAVIKGEARKLTRAEIAELRAGGPSGASVLGDALKGLAKARATGGKAALSESLTSIASAAVRWRDAL